MLNYFLKRLLGLIPTLLIVAVLVFLFVHLLPGDPARLAAGPRPTRRWCSWCARIWGWISRCRSSSRTFVNALRATSASRWCPNAR